VSGAQEARKHGWCEPSAEAALVEHGHGRSSAGTAIAESLGGAMAVGGKDASL
jgi:hypothetical protein